MWIYLVHILLFFSVSYLLSILSFSRDGVKIILRFLFLVYLTIFRSSCRLKYILGYRYSCKYTTKKANIRYKVASLINIMISVLAAVYQYHSEQRVWNLLTSFLAFTCTVSVFYFHHCETIAFYNTILCIVSISWNNNQAFFKKIKCLISVLSFSRRS